jgi:8-hydroxy-5-deazaflavin:NADPH oxidoreductase
MRIAVTGTGKVGGPLGSRWRAAGHDVVSGSRSGSGAGPGGAPIPPNAGALADA